MNRDSAVLRNTSGKACLGVLILMFLGTTNTVLARPENELVTAMRSVDKATDAYESQRVQKIVGKIATVYLQEDRFKRLNIDDRRLLYHIFDRAKSKQNKDRLLDLWLKILTARTPNVHQRQMCITEMLLLSGAIQASNGNRNLQALSGHIHAIINRSDEQSAPLSVWELCDLAEISERLHLHAVANIVERRLKLHALNVSLNPAEVTPYEWLRLKKYYLKHSRRDAVVELADHVTEVYLASDSLSRALRPDELIQLTDMVAVTGSDRTKNRLGEYWRRTLSDRSFVVALPPNQFKLLLMSMDRLGDGGRAAKKVLIATWLGLNNVKVIDSDFTRTTLQAVSGDFGPLLSEMSQAADVVSAGQGIDDRHLALVALSSRLIAPSRTRLTKPQMELHKLVRRIDVAYANQLFAAQPKHAIDWTSRDQALPVFRVVHKPLSGRAVELAVATVLSWDGYSTQIDDRIYAGFAVLLRGEDGQALLEQNLEMNDGKPNLAVAKVMSWQAYRSGENALRTFQKGLQASADQAEGDTKAKWLLARGYAVSMAHGPKRFRHAYVSEFTRSAFASADSDAVRRDALLELAVANLASGRYDASLATLEGAARTLNQSDRDAVMAKVVALRSKADQLRSVFSDRSLSDGPDRQLRSQRRRIERAIEYSNIEL